MTVTYCDLVPFHAFLPAALSRGIHALGVHPIRACATSTVPLIQSNATLSNLSQVPTGNGYPANGVLCSVTEPVEWHGGIYTLNISLVPTLTASGSGFAFKSLCFFNDAAAGKNLIGALFSSVAGQVDITHVEQTDTTATLTKHSHGLSNGDTVVIDRLPLPRLNGTFVVSGVTANTFNITAPVSQAIASQSVSTGKLIKPATVTLAAGGTYVVSFDPATGAFKMATQGVNIS